jgi:hypothetical protein
MINPCVSELDGTARSGSQTPTATNWQQVVTSMCLVDQHTLEWSNTAHATLFQNPCRSSVPTVSDLDRLVLCAISKAWLVQRRSFGASCLGFKEPREYTQFRDEFGNDSDKLLDLMEDNLSLLKAQLKLWSLPMVELHITRKQTLRTVLREGKLLRLPDNRWAIFRTLFSLDWVRPFEPQWDRVSDETVYTTKEISSADHVNNSWHFQKALARLEEFSQLCK